MNILAHQDTDLFFKGGEGMGHQMMDWMMGYGIFPFGGWLVIVVFIVLLVVVLIAGLVWVMTGQSKTPGQVLKDRLAAGEIDEKEYDSLIKKLNK